MVTRETLHPPYGPGSIQPRRLNRWLDVNSQNGPLTRTAKYLVIPKIPPINHNWLGYSDIVGVIYYDAPKNFSLDYPLPFCFSSRLNFLLCVAWQESCGVVKRYVLNDIDRPGFFLDAPVYNGQIIGKYFRFEIWTISEEAPTTAHNSPNLYTSVLGDFDYRFAEDDPLIEWFDALMDNFAVDFPLVFPIEWPHLSTFVCEEGPECIEGVVSRPLTPSTNPPPEDNDTVIGGEDSGIIGGEGGGMIGVEGT